MTVEIPTDLEPFVQRLIAEGRFPTEADVLAEGLRLLQSQESLRSDVQQGFRQLDEGDVLADTDAFAKADGRITAVEQTRLA